MTSLPTPRTPQTPQALAVDALIRLKSVLQLSESERSRKACPRCLPADVAAGAPVIVLPGFPGYSLFLLTPIIEQPRLAQLPRALAVSCAAAPSRAP